MVLPSKKSYDDHISMKMRILPIYVANFMMNSPYNIAVTISATIMQTVPLKEMISLTSLIISIVDKLLFKFLTPKSHFERCL